MLGIRQALDWSQLVCVLFLATLFPPIQLNAEEAEFRAAFGPRTVNLSGRVDSEASADALVHAVQTARPDLTPDRSDLRSDAGAPTFSIPDLISLLAEIALSTHEGRLEIWPNRLVIGGLTDSIVTQSALRVRAAPFLVNRVLHSRLCIVSTDDLPEIAVSLADGSKVASPPSVGVVAAPVVQTPFEAPGLRLEKLLATLALLTDLSPLGAVSAPAPTLFSPSPAPVRAEPLSMETSPTLANPPPSAGLKATPLESLESLPPVYFSANSFLLQANQTETLDALAKHLLSPTSLHSIVRVEAVRPSGGSSTYNDYLCERRAAEVSRLLGERGVNPGILRLDRLDSRSPIDSGEVRLTLVTPPPSSLPPAEATANGPGSAPPLP